MKAVALPVYIIAFGLMVVPSVGDDPSTAEYSLKNQESLMVTDAFQEVLSSLKGASNQDVVTFYKKAGGPVWFFQGNLTKCGHIAVETLNNVAQDGLNPHDYADATQAALKPVQWVDAEILLTKRYLEFIDHIRRGRVDPKRISRNIKFHSPKTQPVDLLLEAIQDMPTQCAQLRHMEPNLPQYRQLKKILADYRELAKNVKEWPHIKGTKSLKLKEEDPEVQTLRKILSIHGDLVDDGTASPTFDSTLEKAVRRFQNRYTLDMDGVVGPKTKEALNLPIDSLISKVIYNMERLRWLPDTLGDRHIVVNVAGYEVRAYEKSDLKLTIPAIVGRPSRRTPLFYASLKNVIINPSWGVPYSILVRDKLPKLRRDPGYARRSGFTVMDRAGNIINPDEADWENAGSSYRLRQRPGARNALGRIKFNIQNPYTIYLHDTPSKNLFQRVARPFSSGCIRLEAPDDLAVWVLNNNSKKEWSHESVDQAIHRGRTKTVDLEEDIPVFFTYQTIWKGGDGMIRVSDDPYRLDRQMAKVLSPENR